MTKRNPTSTEVLIKNLQSTVRTSAVLTPEEIHRSLEALRLSLNSHRRILREEIDNDGQ